MLKHTLILLLLVLTHASDYREPCSEARSKCPTDKTKQSDEEEYTPYFNINGPKTCAEDEAAIFQVQIGETHRYGAVKFYIGIAQDAHIDLYSIGNMRLVTKGKNYECIENDELDYGVFNDSESKLTQYMGHLDLGIVVNCGNAEDIDLDVNILLFEFAVYVMQNSLERSDIVGFCVGVEIGTSVTVNCTNVNILPRNSHPEKEIAGIDVYLMVNKNQIEIAEKGICLIQYGINFGGGEGFFTTKLKVDVQPDRGLSICKVTLVKKGFNLPYIPKLRHDLMKNESNVKELIIDLGRIHITNQVRDMKSASEMVLEVGFCSVSAVLVQANVGIVGKTVLTPAIVSSALVQNEVELNIQPVQFFPSTKIVKSGEIRVDWEFVLPGGSCYESLKITTLKFGNNAHVGKICRLEVSHVGRTMPCVNKTILNNKLQYWKSQLLMDQDPILALENVCVARETDQSDEGNLVISIVGELQWILPTPLDDIFEISTGFLLGKQNYTRTTNMFMLSAKDDVTIDEDYPPSVQAFSLWSDPIPIQLSTLVLIRIKFQPASRGLYKLTLTSAVSGMGICKISFLHVGQNFPCFDPHAFPGDPDPNATTWINYQTHSDAKKGNKLAVLDFGSLANLGTQELVSNQRNDDNTILVAVGLKINSGSKNPYKLQYELTYNTYNMIDVIEVKSDAVTKTQSKVIDFTIDTTNTNMFVNVTKLVAVNIEFFPNFYGQLTVKLQSDTSNIFCCAAVTYVGTNVPCVNASTVDIQMTSSQVRVNLGEVCHAKSTLSEPNSNMVRIEAAILINTKIANPIPSKINLQIELEEIKTLTPKVLSLTLNKDKFTAVHNKLIKLIPLKTKIVIPVGSKKWVPFDVNIPPFTTTPLKLHIQAPVQNKRALLTIYDIRVSHSGLNVKCSMKMVYDVQLSCTSGLPTQNDVMVFNMEYITNTGFSINVGNYTTPDDILTIEVLIRATDHPEVKTDEECPLIITSNNSSSIVQLVTVTRTGIKETERITADLSLNGKEVKQSYGNEDDVALKLIVKHANNSFLEPRKLILVLFIPPFTKIEEFSSNSTNKAVPMNKTYPSYEIANLLFDDVLGIDIALNMIPELRKVTTSTNEVTIVARVLCSTESNSKPHLCAMSFFKIKLKPNICTDQLLLEPCQLSASSAVNELEKSHWSPANRWINGNEWFQINLGNLTLISKIEVVQILPAKQTLMNFQLMTSFDGRSWIQSEKKLINIVTEEATDGLTTRFLRIILSEPKIMDSQLEFEIKLYGCVMSGVESLDSTCEYTPTTILTNDVTRYRHFSIDEAHDIIYFCDTALNKNALVCFCSYDQGNTWKGLPAYIKLILGYNKELKMMLATDVSQKSQLKSHNCIDWMPASELDVIDLKKSASVPALVKNKLGPLPNFGHWTVGFDGIAYNQQLKFKWNDCCNE